MNSLRGRLIRLALSAVALFPFTSIRGEDAAPALKPEELKAIDALIARLDDEEFEVRGKASKDLLAMGERIEATLAARLAALHGQNAEVQSALNAILIEFDTERAMRDLERANPDFVPPDPATEAKLKTRIRFDIGGAMLKQRMNEIGDRVGIRFVVDPELKARIAAQVLSEDHEVGLALKDIFEHCDVDGVLRGRVMVVTTKEQAEQLRKKVRVLKLPDATDGKSWTLEQTQAVAKVIDTWAAADIVHIQPGEFEVRLSDTRAVELDKFLSVLGPPDARLQKSAAPRFKPETQSAYDYLSSRRDFSIKAGDDLGAICFALKDVKAPGDWSAKDVPVFEAIERYSNLAAPERTTNRWMGDNGTSFAFDEIQRPAFECILDLRPALNAGALENQLMLNLEQIVKEAKGYAADVQIHAAVHGCVLTSLDLWTARRAQNMIDAAAKSGKAGDPPPLPEYLKGKIFKPDEKHLPSPDIRIDLDVKD